MDAPFGDIVELAGTVLSAQDPFRHHAEAVQEKAPASSSCGVSTSESLSLQSLSRIPVPSRPAVFVMTSRSPGWGGSGPHQGP